MATLFDPIVLGDLELPNRIVMAPLTRCRADEGRVPNALMAEYYAQRADAGLILSEATAVTPMGVGYPDTPGIWSDDQVRGWSNVTKAVHAAGGRIFLQLWHVGRISDPLYLNGELPVAPSAIAAEGHVSLVRPKRPYVTPRALDTEEIADIVEAYRQGAERAKAAGVTTLVFTVDMPVPGARYRDAHSGMSGPYAAPRRILQAMTHPAWAWDVGLLGKPHDLGNISAYRGNPTGLEDYIGWLGANFDPSISWKDLEWIREFWDGPMVIKGILDPEDARDAVKFGADGIVVSNHGGRQLDGV
ncbi:alpha-hydroxy-acid oxidizing protein, partial [Acinetobacter baumannii]